MKPVKIESTVLSRLFAPVKNSVGADSPQITKKIMITRAVSWLTEAGIKVPVKQDGSIDCKIEIASSFTVCKEDIADKKGKIPQIRTDDIIYLE